jgi:peptidylprolyl isomerase
MNKLAAVLAFVLGASPALAANLEITVSGEANGKIVIHLRDDLAPAHVAQISALANSGAYDGVVFHRVIDGFMAQTGDVEFGKIGGDMSLAGMGGSSLPDLRAEFSAQPFERGIVGMARANDPNSANSQFFIMFEPGYFLNGQYTVIGEVISGMDVVDQIKRGEGQNGAVIGRPDVMTKVVVTE